MPKEMAIVKTMSKVLFGSLDTRNQVDVPLVVTLTHEGCFFRHIHSLNLYISLFIGGERLMKLKWYKVQLNPR